METGREWILVVTMIVCAVLGFAGALLYPLNEQNILVIVLYESLLLLITFGILRLIQKRGLEDW
ncbi:MAG: hypothetical protein ACFFCP_16860 [Promethearchaeota archaeon]